MDDPYKRWENEHLFSYSLWLFYIGIIENLFVYFKWNISPLFGDKQEK